MSTPATACCAEIIPLARPWWRRALDQLHERWLARSADDPYAGLRHLSDETLRDIGAPGFLRGETGSRDRWLLDVRNW